MLWIVALYKTRQQSYRTTDDPGKEFQSKLNASFCVIVY